MNDAAASSAPCSTPHRLNGTDEVFGIAPAPDERYAAFGGYGKFVGLWDLSHGREIRRILGRENQKLAEWESLKHFREIPMNTGVVSVTLATAMI
jgi:hypothetical protein